MPFLGGRVSRPLDEQIAGVGMEVVMESSPVLSGQYHLREGMASARLNPLSTNENTVGKSASVIEKMVDDAFADDLWKKCVGSKGHLEDNVSLRVAPFSFRSRVSSASS